MKVDTPLSDRALTEQLAAAGIRIKSISSYYHLPEEKDTHLFVVKSKQLFELERMAMENIRFYRDSTIAVMPITLDMMAKSGATEDDTDGIATLPRQIQGVEVGITMREVKEDEYRISARSDGRINVSAICQRLGGGGHVRASGARLSGTKDEIIERIVNEVLAEYREVEGE